LIELLVVIAIVSLLVSILLPSLSRARELARSMVCVTNTKQIGTALQMYTNEYGGTFPIPPNTRHPQCLLYLQMDMAPPKEDYPSSDPVPPSIYKDQKTPFNCPNMADNEYGWTKKARGITLSYFPVPGKTLVNSYTFSELTYRWRDWNGDGTVTPTKMDIADIPNASDYMYAFDGRGSFRADGNDAFVNKEINGPVEGDKHIEERHFAGTTPSVNALFYDGHAEGWITSVEPADVKWFAGSTPP
jgi:prepilin-type processing-associated H-X9-DG protein